MPISVLATKCRHCGAEVGRPRRAETNLTINDLGGDTENRYRPSGNVMEALEQFRAEELGRVQAEDEQHSSATWFRRRGHGKPDDAPQAPPPNVPGLPELDEYSRELADIVSSSTPSSMRRAPVRRGGSTEWVKYAAILAGVMLGVIVLFYGGSAVQEMLAARTDDTIAVKNRAPEILESKGSPIEALEAAIEARSLAPTPENLSILNEARAYVVQKVEERLGASPWQPSDLKEAQTLATRALALDGDSVIREMRREVDLEAGDYNFVLVDANPDAGTAQFMLNDPFEAVKDQTVRVGELLNARFLVKSISTREVRLEDTQRQTAGRGRQLKSGLRNVVEPS
jgi:hypothetical protein